MVLSCYSKYNQEDEIHIIIDIDVSTDLVLKGKKLAEPS